MQADLSHHLHDYKGASWDQMLAWPAFLDNKLFSSAWGALSELLPVRRHHLCLPTSVILPNKTIYAKWKGPKQSELPVWEAKTSTGNKLSWKSKSFRDQGRNSICSNIKKKILSIQIVLYKKAVNRSSKCAKQNLQFFCYMILKNKIALLLKSKQTIKHK